VKHFLIILLLCCSTILSAQTTAIPDANFEQALINLGYDTGVPDGVVLTSNINTIPTLIINGKSISDLTGIEDFTNLQLLWCHFNQLTTLDLSQNLALFHLLCNDNQLTQLDLSSNIALRTLICHDNLLTCINIKNGNNTDMTTSGFHAANNPNLICIDVDDVVYSTSNWTNIDAQTSFSTNCNNGCSTVGIDELPSSTINMHPNPTTGLLSITLEEGHATSLAIRNSLGQILLSDKTSSTNQIELDLTNYPTGIYFLQFEVDGQVITKKIVKE